MWGGTSSLPVRFVVSVLERGITDKGQVSLTVGDILLPLIQSNPHFFKNKSVFQCCLCHSDKGFAHPSPASTHRAFVPVHLGSPGHGGGCWAQHSSAPAVNDSYL